MNQTNHPRGFLAAGWNIGIKDSTLDFGVIHSEVPCNAAAVFTRNNFPGNPVLVGKEHIGDGIIQTIVVNSKNANVATGPGGKRDAKEICQLVGAALRIPADRVFPSSTGVIGRPLPMERIRNAIDHIASRLKSGDFESFSRAIMTTDTFPKLVTLTGPDGIRITAVAKGAGMIEPNMATMLAYLVTDAGLSGEDLKWLVHYATSRSFNRVSVDTDTSTSDTFAILANGLSEQKIEISESVKQLCETWLAPEDFVVSAPHEKPLLFIKNVLAASVELARMIARDGEGATRLIEVRVERASNSRRAVKIGRSIINSPLVKTAIYGADPNWGRLVMAIGKVFDEPVPEENLTIYFGDTKLDDEDQEILTRISSYLKENKEVLIRVDLNEGSVNERLWGCDLTEEYIRINAMYTT